MSPATPSSAAGARAIAFDAVADPTGVEIVDPIERQRLLLRTPSAVTPRSVPRDEVPFPVDRVVSVRTAAVEFDNVASVLVRDGTGSIVAEVEHYGDASLPDGEYTIELTTEVKTYVVADGPLTVDADSNRTLIELGESGRIRIGARSRHERPATTVTTTSEPRDVMVAVSALGSALKTTSPERTFPTLRGHPPLVELGSTLDVPVSPPETGIRIELPPELSKIYPAASLAYFLGARLVPGNRPRLVTDRGFEYALDRHPGYEEIVERILKQTFLLDCVVRTEGIYEVPLHERASVESELPFDIAETYDCSLAERLERYLDVPYGDLSGDVPKWRTTTQVEPLPEHLELLPFAVDDLAVIRSVESPEPVSAAAAAEQEALVGEFLRRGDFTRSAADPSRNATSETLRRAGGEMLRSTSPEPSSMPERVNPADRDSLELAWIGEGAPVGGSKPTMEGYQHALDREPSDGAIDITVVCNDPEMRAEEDTASTVYGDREALPFDIDVRRGLDVAELRAALSEPMDFFHYIGHIDAEGFECADGRLDASTLGDVGVDAFLLNACQSYHQGIELVERGAIGGVVTLRDVVNSGAVGMGQTLARLLNRGFPLGAALTVAAEEQFVGNQYVVVGEKDISIAQSESGTPYICTVTETDTDRFSLGIEGYPTANRGLGSMMKPAVSGNDEYYLNSGALDEFDLSTVELLEFLQLEDVPVWYDAELHWSTDLVLESL